MTDPIEDIVNKIHCTDVIEGLKKIPDNSVTLIFTSPPYKVGIKYNTHDDNAQWKDYLEWLSNIWKECGRVLREGGRLAINIDSIVNHEDDRVQEYYRPIYADLINQMRNVTGMNFRTEICWYKQNTVGRKTAWGSWKSPSNPIIRRNHEYILIWDKNTHTLANETGKISDLTPKEFNEFILSTWFITPETRNIGDHPVPFPEKLAKGIIKMNSYPDDIVMDIFSGTGTTCYVAKQLGRKFIGLDLDQKYVDFSNNRLNDISKTDLFEETVKKEEKEVQEETDIFA